jgi:hypothetical protein
MSKKPRSATANYFAFARYRPQGDTLHAKAARAQLAADQRPQPSLPEVLFLRLDGRELLDALVARRRRWRFLLEVEEQQPS